MDETQVAREIERLHLFFEAWFRGELNDPTPFTDCLADSFYLVTPRGERLSRSQIVDSIRSGFGGRDVSIDVRSVRVEAVIGDVVIATYEEHQAEHAGRTARLSTVVLRHGETAPGGYVWEAVHETWLDVPDS